MRNAKKVYISEGDNTHYASSFNLSFRISYKQQCSIYMNFFTEGEKREKESIFIIFSI